MEDCSYVDFSGTLANDLSFVVNVSTQLYGTDGSGNYKNQLPITLYNAEGQSRPWSANPRLQHVYLQYRQVGTFTWQRGLNSSGQFLDATTGYIDPYGGVGVKSFLPCPYSPPQKAPPWPTGTSTTWRTASTRCR